ncbi:MAG: zinc ribbon domain-containing protein [Planctomycetes bacterium]|nr:zinc ribbon domain-containing protein [Planctomycetota bacterium]
MPIYEFYCSTCHVIYQFFSSRINTEAQPTCPKCGQEKLERRMSVFAVSSSGPTSEEGLGENGGELPFDDARMESAMMALAGEAENLDENDPRQAANLMRKLTEASGLKMGRNMEEALSRMEKGEDPDRIEEEMGEVLDAEDPFMPGQGNGRGALRQKTPPRRDETIYDL